jgi:hypothetical protein
LGPRKLEVFVRALLVLLAAGLLIFFGHPWLTKENLLVLFVGLLTLIGLLRVLTHETKCAAKEIFPSLTTMAEEYYAFRTRLRELEAKFQAARSRASGHPTIAAPATEYSSPTRFG